MTKEMRELNEQIENKRQEALALLSENKIKEAQEIKNHIDEMKEKLNLMKNLYNEEIAKIENRISKEGIKSNNDEKSAFLNHVRTRFSNAMTEGTAEQGGHTVPKDIETKINELRQSKNALQNLITVEPVSTLEGSRIFKARSSQTGFVEVAENGQIQEKDTPQFSSLSYKVKKYAGFYKVTNELLADSDQAIERVLVDWIGNESRITRNKLILSALGTKGKTPIADVDDLKKVLNVTLDPDFLPSTVVVTNQDGYNFLDTLQDGVGNYLLQVDLVDKSTKKLFGRYPIHVISNKDLPTDTSAGNKAPILIGDLKEGCVMFERAGVAIAASKSADGAFLTDITLFRAIEREDIKIKDAEAYVYGQITLP